MLLPQPHRGMETSSHPLRQEGGTPQSQSHLILLQQRHRSLWHPILRNGRICVLQWEGEHWKRPPGTGWFCSIATPQRSAGEPSGHPRNAVLDRESSSSGSGSVPAADRCWDYQLPARFQQPAAPESRTAAGALPLPRSLRPGADVRHRPPPARSTNSHLPGTESARWASRSSSAARESNSRRGGEHRDDEPALLPPPVIPTWIWSRSTVQQAV